MQDFSPDFGTLSAIEERLLSARLDAARVAISHAGEKGRSLEGEVTSLLRSFLPAEYGLSTGFIAYRAGEETRLSNQLDIIIYDSLRCGPLVRLGTCDVFPLEAVYGYIEVKASVRSTTDEAESFPNNSIEALLDTNGQLRLLKNRAYWAPITGSTTDTHLWDVPRALAVRGYVVAFSADGTVATNPAAMAARIASYSARIREAHLHGLLVAGHAFYKTVATEHGAASPDAHNVTYTTTHPLSAFKLALLHDLSRFTRFPVNWAPAIDRYSPQPTWGRARP